MSVSVGILPKVTGTVSNLGEGRDSEERPGSLGTKGTGCARSILEGGRRSSLMEGAPRGSSRNGPWDIDGDGDGGISIIGDAVARSGSC